MVPDGRLNGTTFGDPTRLNGTEWRSLALLAALRRRRAYVSGSKCLLKLDFGFAEPSGDVDRPGFGGLGDLELSNNLNVGVDDEGVGVNGIERHGFGWIARMVSER